VCGDIRQICELYARSSAAVGRSGVLPSETVGGRLVVSELVTARPPTVASDHSLRHAGAGAARSRVINDKISLNI